MTWSTVAHETFVIERSYDAPVAKLEVLDASKSRPGRRRTPELLLQQFGAIDAKLPSAKTLARLDLIQERLRLQAALDHLQPEPDTSDVEATFVKVAQSYGECKGISYGAWRTVGVPAAVLRHAGAPRTRSV